MFTATVQRQCPLSMFTATDCWQNLLSHRMLHNLPSLSRMTQSDTTVCCHSLYFLLSFAVVMWQPLLKARETFCNDVKVVDVVDLLKPPCGTFDSISTAVLYESYMHLAVRGGSVIAKACRSVWNACHGLPSKGREWTWQMNESKDKKERRKSLCKRVSEQTPRKRHGSSSKWSKHVSGGIWTHECEHSRTWVYPLRPLGHTDDKIRTTATYSHALYH